METKYKLWIASMILFTLTITIIIYAIIQLRTDGAECVKNPAAYFREKTGVTLAPVMDFNNAYTGINLSPRWGDSNGTKG